MGVLINSIGFVGVGLLILYGVGMIVRPPKNMKKFLHRQWQLLPAVIMIGIGLLPIMYQKEDVNVVSLDEFLGTTDTETINCQSLWKKTQFKDTDAQKKESLSQVVFTYTDSQPSTHSILFTATTLSPIKEESSCKSIYNGIFTSQHFAFGSQESELYQCEVTKETTSIMMASLQQEIKKHPIVVSVITKMEDLPMVLSEVRCIFDKLPVLQTATTQSK